MSDHSPSDGESAASGIRWTAVEKWIPRLLSLATFVVLGRLIDPSDFGLLALALVVVALLSVLADSGIPQAVMQSRALDHDRKTTAFWLSTAFGVALTALCVAVAPLLADAFGEQRLTAVLQVLAIAILVQSIGATPTAFLHRDMRFRALATRKLVSALVAGLIAIGIAIATRSVWALVFQYLIGAIIDVTAVLLVTRFRPGFRFSRSHSRDLLSVGTNVLGSRLLTLGRQHGDNFVVASFLGTVQLGYYSVGYRIFNVTEELVGGMLNAVAVPVFSRMQTEHERLRDAYLKASSISATFGVPFFAISACAAATVIPFVFGDKWLPSVPVMQALAVVGISNTVILLDWPALLAAGRSRLFFYMSAVGAALDITAFVVGAQFSIVGLSIAYAVSSILYWPFRLAFLRRGLGVSSRSVMGVMVAPLICAALVVAAMLGVQALLEGSLGGWLSIPVGVLVYVAALRVVGPTEFARGRRSVSRVLGRS